MAKKKKYSKRSLFKALSQNKINLICELKKASPSEGIIRKRFNPLNLAQQFEAAGASAISVLTESHYFLGNPKTIDQIRLVTNIPLLRKDFIFDSYQIYETALLGADAFLIIVTLVSDQELKNMLAIAKELNLEALVEVHTKEELSHAIKAGCEIIGINNRNLKTLQIDLSTAERLIPLIPKGIVTVVESGIENRKDILRYQSLGTHNFLIGTILMKSSKVAEKIEELLGKTRLVNAEG